MSDEDVPKSNQMRNERSAHPRDDCYLCGDESDVLESHHLVPRRYNGSDKDRERIEPRRRLGPLVAV